MSNLAPGVAAACLLVVSSLLSVILSHILKDTSRAKGPVLATLLVVTLGTGALTVASLIQENGARRKSQVDLAALQGTVDQERTENGRFRDDVRVGLGQLLAQRPALKRDTVFIRLQETVKEASTVVRVTDEIGVEKTPPRSRP